MPTYEGARNLGIVACCLFLLSLALPATEMTIGGRSEVILGWQAAVMSVSLAKMLGADLPSSVVVLAGIGNVVFVIAPWMVLKKHNDLAISRAYAIAVLIALLLAVATAFTLSNGTLREGYFAWVTAYVLLLGAASMRAARTLGQP
jgi:hypothetical protein